MSSGNVLTQTINEEGNLVSINNTNVLENNLVENVTIEDVRRELFEGDDIVTDANNDHGLSELTMNKKKVIQYLVDKSISEAKIKDGCENVNFIDKKKLTSSTVGDLPNNEALISHNVNEISATAVDFIKIGVYDNFYINTLCKIKSSKKLIAVFFADVFLPTESEMISLKESGFSGVMVDTSNKKLGNLFFKGWG